MSQDNLVICIKQHLSNFWGSIYEKVTQHWGLSWKKVLLIKKRVLHCTLTKTWEHFFGANTKFAEKLTFLNPWYAHVRFLIRRCDILVSRKILRTQNGWSLIERQFFYEIATQHVLRLSSRKSVCDAKFSIEKGNNKIVIDYLDLNPVPFGTHLLFEFYQHH